MTEQLISFETAKLAKEKGFEDRVNNAFYTFKGKLNSGKLLQTYNFTKNGEGCDAPTQSLLQKWLREEKEVVVLIGLQGTDNEFTTTIDYDFKDGDSTTIYVWGYYKTYEKALEKGLKEALKLI